MVVEWITAAVLLLAVLGEWRHAQRVRRIAALAFGPAAAPALWTRFTPLLRVAAISAAVWGFLSLLLMVEPRIHSGSDADVTPDKLKHLVLVVDISPSMALTDAGTEAKDTRRQRAADVLESLFQRVPIREYRVSIIAVYSDAKPMLEDSKDFEVARYILSEMPLWHAFKPGKTNLFAGIQLAAKMAHGWNPRSTTIILLTDGDTVPATGMPAMPDSVANVIVIGVGDTKTGQFIDGHQSRQNIATLRQVAHRLEGIYHDGNQKHITSEMINAMNASYRVNGKNQWSRREWSLLAALAGSSVLAALPILLSAFGTNHRPGVRARGFRPLRLEKEFT